MINHARRTRYLTQVRLPPRRPRSFVEQNDDDDDDGGAALRPVERPRDLENSRQGEVPGRNFVYSHVMSIGKGDVEDVGLHLVLSSRRTRWYGSLFSFCSSYDPAGIRDVVSGAPNQGST